MKNFTKGSLSQFKHAVENRIAQLADTPAEEAVESATVVAAKEIKYIDDSGMMGQPGEVWTEKELLDYYRKNKFSDPVLQEAEDAESWLKETLSFMSKVEDYAAVESATNTCSIPVNAGLIDDVMSYELPNEWELLEHKMIKDSDGYDTDYSLWKNNETGEYCCMLGDLDIYHPSIDSHDGDFDDYAMALEFYQDAMDIEPDDDEESETIEAGYEVGDYVEYDSNYYGVNPKIGTGKIVGFGGGLATHGYTDTNRIVTIEKEDGYRFKLDEPAIIRKLDEPVKGCGDVQACGDVEACGDVTASVDWAYYSDPKFEMINAKYLPASGEGDNKATQIVTAVNKLIYKWYNDGDVYDNNYMLTGWANDLSSYANWLYNYCPECQTVLSRITEIRTSGQYEDILKALANMLLDDEDLERAAQKPAIDSIYTADGPFTFTEEWGEDDEDEEYWDDEYEEDEF